MNFTVVRFVAAVTTLYGIPYERVAEKSGWRLAVRPIDAMYVAELGSTGSESTRRFHHEVAGKTAQPESVGPVAATSEAGTAEPPSAAESARQSALASARRRPPARG